MLASGNGVCFYGGMILTAAALLFAFAALLRGLRHGFYALHIVLVLGSLALIYGWQAGEPFSAPSLWAALIVHMLWINGVTFFAYAWDKRAASRNAWRIPERTLHALALVGGTPGGFLASRIFHHKTRKTRFRLQFWLITLLQLALLVAGYRLTQGQ